MKFLLAFSPFFTFAIVDRLVGVTEGLIVGALVAVALLIKDFVGKKEIKVLDVGTILLFGGLAIYASGWGANDSILGVRLKVDAGLFLIVLISIAIRRPFTLQYAREDTPEEVWNTPLFLRTNYVITGVWALAFVFMVGADIAMLNGSSTKAGIWVTIGAIYAAIKFTAWYPKHVRESQSNA